LALALALPPEVPQRDLIVTASFAVVAFSVFVQGLRSRPAASFRRDFDSKSDAVADARVLRANQNEREGVPLVAEVQQRMDVYAIENHECVELLGETDVEPANRRNLFSKFRTRIRNTVRSAGAFRDAGSCWRGVEALPDGVPMRSELVPIITAGRLAVSVTASQFTSGPAFAASPLADSLRLPTCNRGSSR
jgi:hypothetical protein